jgi:aryl-alcohol dehydrogenase-like predicted oxidoreductase
MEYTTLGETGLEVSQVCLGTWKFGTKTDGVVETDREESHELLDAAWNRGINFFDTANSYGQGRSEQYIGEWRADGDGEDIVLASKVYWTTRGRRERGLSRKIIRSEIEGTLERLGTEYLDLYYIHMWHDETPIEETLATLNDLVREGRVRYIGASNLATWQLLKALWTSEYNGWEQFSVVQPRYNAITHDPVVQVARPPYDTREEKSATEMIDACRDKDVGICGYSPLAGGFLTGKYKRDGEPPAGSRASLDDDFGEFETWEWETLDAIRDVAAETGATPTQVAIRWAMDIEAVTSVPIVGARSVDQIEENSRAVDLSLSPEQYERIAAAGKCN